MKSFVSARMARYGFLAALTLAACVVALPAAAQDAAKAEQPAASGDMAPLKIELPEPAFGGTPLNYYGPNLEPASFKKRAPFMAPAGAENVAKGKKVTASAEPSMGELEMVTDGEKSAGESSLVELPAGDKGQWVQIDLGAEYNIFAVLAWHFFAYDRVYFDVVAQVADNPDFTNATTVYNNDIDNNLGLGAGKDKEYIESYEGRLIDAKGVKGRYVRLYTRGNTTDQANHVIEVEVYGKPAA